MVRGAALTLMVGAACMPFMSPGTSDARSAGAPRMALSSTISIPLPSVGKTGFATVTVSGRLGFHVKDPGLTLSLSEDPRTLPVKLQAAAGETKPVTRSGTTSVEFHIWMNNVRGGSGVHPSSKTLDLVLIGTHVVWAAGPVTHESSAGCQGLAKLSYTTYFQFRGSASAHTMLMRAARAAGCP